MRLSTILKALAVLIVAVIVGAIIVVINIDFNQYKDLIAEKVKEATGRTLVIDGDIKLELSLSPSLAVDGVKFENAPWGSRPQMATVDKFSAQVALLPLLTKTVEVNYVLLSGADILIERDAKGLANFEFESAAPKPTTAPKEGAKSAPAAASDDLPIPVVRKVLIENAKLTYIDAASGQKHVLLLDKISLAGDGPGEPVDMSFAMTVDGQPISGGGQLGALGALTDPAKAWPLKLDVEAGGAKVAIGGSIQDAVGVSGLDLTLAVSGQSFATLSQLAGAPIPPIGPYSISTKVRGGLRTAIELADIAVKIGKSDIGGHLKAKLGGKRPSVDVAFKSTLIDLADFQPADGKKSVAKGGDKAADKSAVENKSANDGRVLPNTPLPVDALKLADANIRLAAKRVLANGPAIENIDVAISLKGGNLHVSPLKAEIAKGTIDGQIRLDGYRATPALAVTMKALKIDLGKLLTDADVTDLLEGAININVKLNGSGKSVRSLASGLDGQVKAVMGEGRVKTTALDAFIGGPTQVVAKRITGDKTEYTVLNCVVSQTDIKKGIANISAAVIDTEYARIVGKGKVNLGTEELNVVVTPEPKSATLNLAVAVKVGGTLGDPSYGLDEFSVLRKLGGVVLGGGFPPALLLGLGELGTDSDNPCLKPAASSGGKPPSAQKESSDPITKGIEGAGSLLKGLFGK